MRIVLARQGLILGMCLAALSGIALVVLLSQKSSQSESAGEEAFRTSFTVTQVPLPDSLSIAGESIPLDIWYVRESLDRELLVNVYWQSNTLLMIKRAARWLPEMKSIFRKMGVPEDLVYLALVESGLTGAVSPAGAEGYWQFIESTGKSYGLEISGDVDERYHISKSTEAAARYLLAAKARFGNWLLAVAAYNRGMDGLGRAINSQGGKRFFDLWLNSETTRYIYRLLAIKLIIDSPADYGFHLRAMDLYPPLTCDTVKVDTSVSDLPAFAKQLGISFRTLKEYNPWLKTYSLSVKSRPYYLLVPRGGVLNYPEDWQSPANREYIKVDR